MGDNRRISDPFAGPLGESAFIAADDVRCLYKPDEEAAVRMRPPFGTEVQILQNDGRWVLIRWLAKDAWCLRANLSPRADLKKQPTEVGIVPHSNPNFRAPKTYVWKPELQLSEQSLKIEIGPRGGRYVRTAKGFRRYL